MQPADRCSAPTLLWRPGEPVWMVQVAAVAATCSTCLLCVTSGLRASSRLPAWVQEGRGRLLVGGRKRIHPRRSSTKHHQVWEQQRGLQPPAHLRQSMSAVVQC